MQREKKTEIYTTQIDDMIRRENGTTDKKKKGEEKETPSDVWMMTHTTKCQNTERKWEVKSNKLKVKTKYKTKLNNAKKKLFFGKMNKNNISKKM